MNIRRLTVGSLKSNVIKQTTSVKVIRSESVEIHDESKIGRKQQAKIEVIQDNKMFRIYPEKTNVSLLDMAIEQDQFLSYKCKKGSCGKCKVKVVNGLSCLGEPTVLEEKKLREDMKRNYRLACQAVVVSK